MLAEKAITLSLGDLTTVVISKYQFGMIVNHLYKKKSYRGESVHLLRDHAEKSDVNKYLDKLEREGVLFPHKTLSGVYTLLGRSDHDPEEVACTIDPFCYISHLSAMSYHSLTDRIPSKLFISSPPSKEWHIYANEQMEKDLGEDYENYKEYGLPPLKRIQMKKINKTEVHCFSSKHRGAYKNVQGRTLKVSTIGRTFLDMLRNPELCGGINHILDVFQEYGEQYLRLITDEIDLHGAPIDKVRGGYILNELLGIDDNEVVESWVKYAQRGGSRKLDPRAEYLPEWSEKWQISLNS